MNPLFCLIFFVPSFVYGFERVYNSHKLPYKKSCGVATVGVAQMVVSSMGIMFVLIDLIRRYL